MPAGICLPPKVIDTFKRALVSGKIDPEKMATMTSEQRHSFLADIVGEGNAKFVNGQFEAKMLLKNQQQGYLTWAKKLTGVTPAVRRDLISRISKMDRVLNPAEERVFLKDLAETKLGFGVTADEAKQIANKSMHLQELESKRAADGTFKSEADRMAFGRAKTDLGNFLGEMKLNATHPKITTMLKTPVASTKHLLAHPIEATSRIAGTAKSVKAAFDDSALMRQGWKTMLTHPGIWGRNVRKNIMDLYKQGIKNEDMMREATADVVSRPNSAIYEKMGIAPKVEEEFGDPTLIMKIPGIGRIYKTTEVAFNAFMLRTRADLADHYIDIAKKAGVNINDPKELKAIGRMIGGLTGRGDLGRFEGAAANATNNIFFSPRFVKSQIDTFAHPITGAGGSNFVRKEAAKNLVKIVGATAAIFASIDAIRPGTIELDPRSSNFGKVKIGDTTFDLTGGFSAIAVLAARLYTNQYKSSSKGTVTTLGSSPAAPKGSDLITQFIQGKLSPAAQRVWVHAVTKQEFNGQKPNLASDASNLFEPLPYSTYTEAKNDPHGANALATELADALGISANTSNPAQQVKPLTKTDQALKTSIGPQKFQDYQKAYNNKVTTFLQSDYYRQLPNDQKQKAYMRAETKIKSNLYKQYGFKPPKKTSNSLLNKQVDSNIPK